jgi:hypothetical protein
MCCWFSRFGFIGKSICVMCVCVCVCVPLYILFFIKNLFAVIYYTRLKCIFGIKEIIGFMGMHLWLGVFIRLVISLVTMGDLQY